MLLRCSAPCSSRVAERSTPKSRTVEPGIRWHVADRLCAPPAERLFTCHGLADQVTKRKIDGFCVGVPAIALHDGPEMAVLYLDVRAHLADTPLLHQKCKKDVPTS